jgi:Protein of unknown function (DUF2490)
MKFIKIFFLLFLSSFGLTAQTEKKIQHQSLFWSRYYNQLNLNDEWSIHTELDNRVFTKPIEQNLFVFRIQGRYKINENVEAGAGFVYFSVSTQEPDLYLGFKIPEYRGQQDIVLKQPFGKFNLIHRFQVEERFITASNKEGLLDKTNFNWRFRYRIQGDYTFWKRQNQFLKAIVSDEIMFNGGKEIVKNTFDQNRVYGALQYGISKAFAVELGYLNSFQQRASGVDYYDRDIIRLSIYHKIKL